MHETISITLTKSQPLRKNFNHFRNNLITTGKDLNSLNSLNSPHPDNNLATTETIIISRTKSQPHQKQFELVPKTISNNFSNSLNMLICNIYYLSFFKVIGIFCRSNPFSPFLHPTTTLPSD